MSEARRKHPRYAIDLDAAILAPDKRVDGRTRNLSEGGFCLLATDSLPLGTSCTAKLALVFSENQFSEHLELPSTVVWCTPHLGKYQIGVKFNSLDTASRGYLGMFIKFLEEGDESAEESDEELPPSDSSEDL